MAYAEVNGQRLYYEDSGGDGPAVLFLSRHEERKGLGVLIEAVALTTTVLVVAHRLSTVTSADRILVMGCNPGRILEVVEVPVARPRACRTPPAARHR